MIRLLACILVLMLAPILHAQDKMPGPAPSLAILGRSDPEKGLFTLLMSVIENAPVTETRKVVTNGVEQTVTVTVVKAVSRQAELRLFMKEWRVHTASGRALSNDEAWQKLKAGNAIARSSNEHLPDEVFLAALHPDTLVLVPIPKK
jgi:hypothetical protein